MPFSDQSEYSKASKIAGGKFLDLKRVFRETLKVVGRIAVLDFLMSFVFFLEDLGKVAGLKACVSGFGASI